MISGAHLSPLNTGSDPLQIIQQIKIKIGGLDTAPMLSSAMFVLMALISRVLSLCWILYFSEYLFNVLD